MLAFSAIFALLGASLLAALWAGGADRSGWMAAAPALFQAFGSATASLFGAWILRRPR